METSILRNLDGLMPSDLYQEAASIYRGPYLEEDMYEDWAIGHREMLQNLFVGALE